MKKIFAVIAILAILAVGMTACTKAPDTTVPAPTNEPAVMDTYEVPEPVEIIQP